MEKASRFPGAGDPMSLLSLCGSPEARLSWAPPALTPAWPWGSGRPAWAHSRRMVSSVTQLAWHAVPCSARSPRQAGVLPVGSRCWYLRWGTGDPWVASSYYCPLSGGPCVPMVRPLLQALGSGVQLAP